VDGGNVQHDLFSDQINGSCLIRLEGAGKVLLVYRGPILERYIRPLHGSVNALKPSSSYRQQLQLNVSVRKLITLSVRHDVMFHCTTVAYSYF